MNIWENVIFRQKIPLWESKCLRVDFPDLAIRLNTITKTLATFENMLSVRLYARHRSNHYQPHYCKRQEMVKRRKRLCCSALSALNNYINKKKIKCYYLI